MGWPVEVICIHLMCVLFMFSHNHNLTLVYLQWNIIAYILFLRESHHNINLLAKIKYSTWVTCCCLLMVLSGTPSGQHDSWLAPRGKIWPEGVLLLGDKTPRTDVCHGNHVSSPLCVEILLFSCFCPLFVWDGVLTHSPMFQGKDWTMEIPEPYM